MMTTGPPGSTLPRGEDVINPIQNIQDTCSTQSKKYSSRIACLRNASLLCYSHNGTLHLTKNMKMCISRMLRLMVIRETARLYQEAKSGRRCLESRIFTIRPELLRHWP